MLIAFVFIDIYKSNHFTCRLDIFSSYNIVIQKYPDDKCIVVAYIHVLAKCIIMTIKITVCTRRRTPPWWEGGVVPTTRRLEHTGRAAGKGALLAAESLVSNFQVNPTLRWLNSVMALP